MSGALVIVYVMLCMGNIYESISQKKGYLESICNVWINCEHGMNV